MLPFSTCIIFCLIPIHILFEMTYCLSLFNSDITLILKYSLTLQVPFHSRVVSPPYIHLIKVDVVVIYSGGLSS